MGAQVPGARSGSAVERPLFVDINGGIASKPGALTTATTFTIFGEDGAAATRVEPGTSAMVDLRIGYHVRRHVAVAAAVSAGQSDATGATTATIPSPIRFASPTIVSFDAAGSKRREVGVHLQAVYSIPVAEHVMLSVAGGPSLVHLQQGVPNLNVTTATPTVAAANESGNGFGGNVGADLSTQFSTRYGIGVFVRYVGASVDLPSASGVKAGGVQAGAGLRLYF